ncbi:MAG: nuclear transport factor 2 family protein [Planctomyces sp.]|nr:nuclear transport factor 2 family protein [Planctomyces sp.]
MKRGVIAVCFVLLSFAGSACVNADDAAVRKAMKEFVDVFNQRDAAKLASLWTETATHTDRETGERTEGRAAIQADFATVFSEQAEIKLAVTVERVKLVTPDVASVEGQTNVVLSDSDPIEGKFTAVLVHQGDRWLIDSIDETTLPLPATSADALKELEWLVGEWVDESEEATVRTTFRWSANQAFLLRSFTVESNGESVLQGTQVIGWDPRTQQIRSWSFNSDGSFGESYWSRNDNSWLSKSTQTSTSGDLSAGTYVLEKIDDNSFTIQLIGHEINGESQPGSAPVNVARVPNETVIVPASSNSK